MTRQLLLSTNMYEYIAGTNTLGCLLNDGGHTDTGIGHTSQMDSSTDFYKTMGNTVKAKLEEFYGYCPEYAALRKVDEDIEALSSKLIQARIAKIGRGVTYYKEGNTAYCLFNAFDCDFAAWRKFYKEKVSSLPSIAIPTTGSPYCLTHWSGPRKTLRSRTSCSTSQPTAAGRRTL